MGGKIRLSYSFLWFSLEQGNRYRKRLIDQKPDVMNPWRNKHPVRYYYYRHEIRQIGMKIRTPPPPYHHRPNSSHPISLIRNKLRTKFESLPYLYTTYKIDVSVECIVKYCTAHCKKGLAIFPSSAGMSLTKLSLTRNYIIIPCQGEFGKWHPGWGPQSKELGRGP